MIKVIDVRAAARPAVPVEHRPVIVLPLAVVATAPARAAKECNFPNACKWPTCEC